MNDLDQALSRLSEDGGNRSDLELVRAKIEALRALLREATEKCHHCGEIATWQGSYDGGEFTAYGCDQHKYAVVLGIDLEPWRPYAWGIRIKAALEETDE